MGVGGFFRALAGEGEDVCFFLNKVKRVVRLGNA